MHFQHVPKVCNMFHKMFPMAAHFTGWICCKAPMAELTDRGCLQMVLGDKKYTLTILTLAESFWVLFWGHKSPLAIFLQYSSSPDLLQIPPPPLPPSPNSNYRGNFKHMLACLIINESWRFHVANWILQNIPKDSLIFKFNFFVLWKEKI